MKPRLALLVIVIAALAVGVTITTLTRSSAPTTSAPAQAPDTIIQVQTRVLDRPDAEHPASFTTIDGIRELGDGRVLVLDSRERTVQIVDPVSGRSERVGKMGKGPGEYTLPVALIPLAGDSSGIVDEATRRILVVLPDGATGGVFPMYPSGVDRDESRLGGADSRGLLYAKGGDSRKVGGRTVGSDSTPIFRWAPGQDRADTVTWTRLQATTVSESMRGKAHVIAVRHDPFKAQDVWAVALTDVLQRQTRRPIRFAGPTLPARRQSHRRLRSRRSRSRKVTRKSGVRRNGAALRSW